VDARKHKRIINECLSLLAADGIEADENLRELIGFFFSADHHVSTDDMRAFARSRNIEISDIQIRDALDLLVEYGFAVEKEFGGTIRFEHLHPGEHHDHFYCVKCGSIIEFYSEHIEEAQLTEASKYQFHPFSHRMQINGLCNRCFGRSVSELVPLAMIDTGARFTVQEIAGQGACEGNGKKRLLDMGLVPGVSGEIVANHGGRIVICINSSRIALGRGLSQRVMVSLTD
jgi:Fur family transcriptional regulator, ferric uptake regulator